MRVTPEEKCSYLPRKAFVNPTSREISKAVPTGHTERELKQVLSGPGVYKPLLTALLSGMGLGAQDCVVIVDDTGYDAWPAKTVLELVLAPPERLVLPKLGVVTNCWLGTKEATAATAKHCEVEIKGALRQFADRGGPLVGYTKIPELSQVAECPELDLAKFKRCMPDKAAFLLLPKEAEVSKFLACPVVGAKARAWLDGFNVQFNPSGRFHSEAASIIMTHSAARVAHTDPMPSASRRA